MNQANYRNKRFDNKRGKAHGFNSKGTLFKKFMGIFGRKGKSVAIEKLNKVSPPISQIFKRKRSYHFNCKPKSTNCAIKQYAQMRKDHSHLWNGSVKLVVS